MTTQELEAVKKEISEVSAFVKERVQPLREERDRLEKTITDLTATERDIRRRALLSDGSGQRRRVESGLYAGSDVLDLAIARSLYASARITGKSAGLDECLAGLAETKPDLEADDWRIAVIFRPGAQLLGAGGHRSGEPLAGLEDREAIGLRRDWMEHRLDARADGVRSLLDQGVVEV